MSSLTVLISGSVAVSQENWMRKPEKGLKQRAYAKDTGGHDGNISLQS